MSVVAFQLNSMCAPNWPAGTVMLSVSGRGATGAADGSGRRVAIEILLNSPFLNNAAMES